MKDITSFLTALTPLMTALTPLFLALIAYLTIRNKNRNDVKLAQVASKVQEVSNVAAQSVQAAEVRDRDLMDKTKEIHTLVNSQYGIQLTKVLDLAIKLANISKDPRDRAAVEVARGDLADHEAKQHRVDAGEAQ